MNDIMMPCALTENDELILINSIKEYNRHEEYKCPICGGKIVPCSILDTNKYSAYFKHNNKSNCSTESMIHYWYKNQYIVPGDKFYISVNNKTIEYTCKETLIEQVYNTTFGKYIPDVTVITKNDEKVFFEYKYTNKKDIELYSNKWRELDCSVIEIDIKTLEDVNKDNRTFKPLFHDGLVRVKTRNKEDSVLNNYIKKNNIVERKRILYLNGLLRDFYKYTINELSIDELAYIIDSCNEKDKELIPSLLKCNCNLILEDYCHYKQLKHIKRMKDIIYSECKNYSFINLIQFDDLDLIYSRRFSDKLYGVRFNNILHIKSEYIEYGENIFGRDIDEKTLRNKFIKLLYRKAIDINEKRINSIKNHRKNKIMSFIENNIIFVPRNKLEKEVLYDKRFKINVFNNYEKLSHNKKLKLAILKDSFLDTLIHKSRELKRKERIDFIKDYILSESLKYIENSYCNDKYKQCIEIEKSRYNDDIYIRYNNDGDWLYIFDKYETIINRHRINTLKEYLDSKMNEIIKKCKQTMIKIKE